MMPQNVQSSGAGSTHGAGSSDGPSVDSNVAFDATALPLLLSAQYSDAGRQVPGRRRSVLSLAPNFVGEGSQSSRRGTSDVHPASYPASQPISQPASQSAASRPGSHNGSFTAQSGAVPELAASHVDGSWAGPVLEAGLADRAWPRRLTREALAEQESASVGWELGGAVHWQPPMPAQAGEQHWPEARRSGDASSKSSVPWLADGLPPGMEVDELLPVIGMGGREWRTTGGSGHGGTPRLGSRRPSSGTDGHEESDEFNPEVRRRWLTQ